MQATKDILTVLMTVYNGMPYLQTAVESILQQSYKNFSFLILNNGSTDGTKAYLESLAEKSSKTSFNIIHLPENIGRTPVLNRALQEVKTELVAVIDADDIAEPDRLKKQLDYLMHNSDIVLVGSDVLKIDQDGKVLGQVDYAGKHEDLLSSMPLYNQFAHAACTYRLKAVLEAGGYPEDFTYAQDYALWLKLLKNGGKVASIKTPLARIRSHSKQESKKDEQETLRIKEDIRLMELFCDIPNLPAKAEQAAYLRMAVNYFRLGDKNSGRNFLKKSFLLKPLAFFFNPILWKRLLVQLKKLYFLIKLELK